MNRRRYLRLAGLSLVSTTAGCTRLGGGTETAGTAGDGDQPTATPSQSPTETEGPSETTAPDDRACPTVDGTHSVEPAFTTPDRGDNIDSPAVWHGDDRDLLLVTAKESHELVVFDATDGTYLRSLGSQGTDLGSFDRPNGIWTLDDLCVVVERDNARVQVLRLPSGEFLGTFGTKQLQRPYGCTTYATSDGYELFVTDDYEASTRSALDERVHHFRFTVEGDDLRATHVRSFGATDPPGALEKVESIAVDPSNDRLMIADEETLSIKRFDLAGNFQDVVSERFDADPEGIALHRCGDDGFWVFTDQVDPSRFHLYDRVSLDYQATFRHEGTTITDGVWLTQQTFGPFDGGAFYAVDEDRRVTAFDWDEVLSTLAA